MKHNTNKLITTIFSLLIFSTFILNVYVFTIASSYYDMAYWAYYMIVGIFAVIANIILYKYKQSSASLNISMVFVLLILLSIVTLPFKNFWLGSFTGTTTQLANGVFFFIMAPLVIKIVDYLKSNNKDTIEVIIAVFVMLRWAMELMVAGTISNPDFLGFTGLFALVIIMPSIKLSNWKNHRELIKIAGVITSIIMIIFSQNKSAVLSLSVAPISVYLFYIIVKKLISENIATKLNIIIPISIMIITTLTIITLKLNDFTAPDNLPTLWQRAAMIESALASFDLKSLFIGNGWGLSNLFIHDNIWVDGISNTINNTYDPNADYQTVGIGINHIHNELFEYFTGGGIVALVLYISLWLLLSYYARHSILKISILSAITLLYTTWFIHTADTILLITMFAIMANGSKAKANKPASQKIQNITKRFNIINGFVVILICMSYLSYMKELKTNMPKSAKEDSWYSPNATGMRNEQKLWRQKFGDITDKLAKNREVTNPEIIYMVEIIKVMKKLAFEDNNKNAIFDLPLFYHRLFSEKTSNSKLNYLREQQFQYWEKSILLATDTYKNRFDLSSQYLQWHLSNGYEQPVDKLSKRLLKQNPKNAVALYWRGIFLINRNNSSGYDLIEKAFKENITRYQVVDSGLYKKYKHLLNPKYK